MSVLHGIKYIDTGGTAHGFIDNGGAPQICAQDYLHALAEGDISGHTIFDKYGRCSVSNSTIDIWDANAAYVFPASATKLDVTSTDNTDDKAGGAGALKVKIRGLNGSNADTTEEVTLNGTTIVTTSASFNRVNQMWISSAGANGVGTGTLHAKVTGGATVYSQILPGFTRSRQLIHSVPSGKTIYITSVSLSAGVGNTTSSAKQNYILFTFRAKVDPGTGAVSTLFYPVAEIGLMNTTFVRQYEMPLKFPATCDFKISVIGDTALATSVTAVLRGWME